MENISEDVKKFNVPRRLGYLMSLISILVQDDKIPKFHIEGLLKEIEKHPIPDGLEEKEIYINLLKNKLNN